MVIFKYKIPLAPASIQLRMHRDAQLLDAQIQGKELVLWTREECENHLVMRTINVVMTGQELDFHPGKYIATAQISVDGVNTFVSHVFDGGEIT